MQSIMVIDDSEADQFFAKLEIEKFDSSIHVLQAYDGLQALEMLKNQSVSPDIIFLDINMPRMSGHEFLEAYVSNFKDKSMVIMLSSSTLEIDKNRALRHDCVRDYIEKPLNSALLSRARSMLKSA
tara:strand:- start:263 stop:640 length:378 start_codon:yes stop_codon:yes gene_type:complete